MIQDFATVAVTPWLARRAATVITAWGAIIPAAVPDRGSTDAIPAQTAGTPVTTGAPAPRDARLRPTSTHGITTRCRVRSAVHSPSRAVSSFTEIAARDMATVRSHTAIRNRPRITGNTRPLGLVRIRVLRPGSEARVTAHPLRSIAPRHPASAAATTSPPAMRTRVTTAIRAAEVSMVLVAGTAALPAMAAAATASAD